LTIKLIKDLDQLRGLAFPPPYRLLESVEDAERRGEPWRVIMAFERHSEQASWVKLLPDRGASEFFLDGKALSGRWDADHEVFIAEDGPSLNLMGKPVSLSALEDEAADEDLEAEERKWQLKRKKNLEASSLRWGQGER
jgi:hypothetical protein